MMRDKLTRRRAAGQRETVSGSGADSTVVASSPASAMRKAGGYEKERPSVAGAGSGAGEQGGAGRRRRAACAAV